jgi:hypothetical protein
LHKTDGAEIACSPTLDSTVLKVCSLESDGSAGRNEQEPATSVEAESLA